MAAHPVDEKLPALKMAASGLQHVAAMYAGVVAPPLIVGAAIGLSAADLTFLTGACLFTAGLATFLQTLGFWKIGARLPFVNGVTFAGVAPMTAVVAATEDKSDALPVIFGAVVVAGLLGFLAAPFFSKAIRFFPPVVTGSVITLIGVSLLPVAFGWAQGPDPRADDYGSATYLTLAGVTLLIVLLLRRFTRGFVKQIAVLLGLVAGTLIAIPFGVTDFGPVADADVVGFPTPFHFGVPRFQLAAILSLCVVMVVSMTESTADMLALGEIVERPADERTIAAGLRADTLGSAISPLFNGFMCSAFAQNIGLVAMTRIRSRYVVATGGGFLVADGPVPDGRLAHRGRPPSGPRRRRCRPVRLGRRERHPDPGPGRPRQGQQRPDRGRLPRGRHRPDHRAGLLPRLPADREDRPGLGDLHRLRHGRRPEPPLQPRRQGPRGP